MALRQAGCDRSLNNNGVATPIIASSVMSKNSQPLMASSSRQMSVVDAMQWLGEQGIELSRRDAQRRIRAAVQRVQQGHSEPWDRQVQRITHVYTATQSWWLHEVERRPPHPRGRPRKQHLHEADHTVHFSGQ